MSPNKSTNPITPLTTNPNKPNIPYDNSHNNSNNPNNPNSSIAIVISLPNSLWMECELAQLSSAQLSSGRPRYIP